MATLKADCIKYGISYKTVQGRMNDYGRGRWEALLKPLQTGGRKPMLFRWQGKDRTYAELASMRGIGESSLRSMVCRKGLIEAMSADVRLRARSGYNG